MERDDFQKLIALIDDLSQEQRDLVKKALDGENDLERVVSIIENRLAAKRQCAHCHSENIKKWGKSQGLQRYRCYDCGKTFNSLTNSSLAFLRKKDRWLKMALALKEGLSVRKTAARCGISVPTAFRWRHRFLKAAAADKPIKLEGIAEADETYFLESVKGPRRLPRPAGKRGGKALTARTLQRANSGLGGLGPAWRGDRCRFAGSSQSRGQKGSGRQTGEGQHSVHRWRQRIVGVRQ